MMKFYKPDDENRRDLSLIKLKICTEIHVEDNDNWNEKIAPSQEVNLEFDLEAIKGITMIETDKKGKNSMLKLF